MSKPTAVDCQHLPGDTVEDPNDQYVIQLEKKWNGNDIFFVSSVQLNYDYNYRKAAVFSFGEAYGLLEYYDLTGDHKIFTSFLIHQFQTVTNLLTGTI